MGGITDVFLTRNADQWVTIEGRPAGRKRAFLREIGFSAIELSGNTIRVDIKVDPIGILEHETAITARAFSPDQHWLATGTDTGIVRLWPLRASELIARACPLLPRNLSEQECTDARLETRQTCVK